MQGMNADALRSDDDGARQTDPTRNPTRLSTLHDSPGTATRTGRGTCPRNHCVAPITKRAYSGPRTDSPTPRGSCAAISAGHGALAGDDRHDLIERHPMALQFPEKKHLRLAPLGLVLAAGLTLSACGGGDDASSDSSSSDSSASESSSSASGGASEGASGGASDGASGGASAGASAGAEGDAAAGGAAGAEGGDAAAGGEGAAGGDAAAGAEGGDAAAGAEGDAAAGGAAGAEGGAGAEDAAGAEGGAASGAVDPYNGGVPESVGVDPGAAPSIQPGPYTVTQGDTLGYISTLSGITVDDIAAANGLSNVDQLEVGQTITIPEAG